MEARASRSCEAELGGGEVVSPAMGRPSEAVGTRQLGAVNSDRRSHVRGSRFRLLMVVDVADPLELVAWLALFARCSAQVSFGFRAKELSRLVDWLTSCKGDSARNRLELRSSGFSQQSFFNPAGWKLSS